MVLMLLSALKEITTTKMKGRMQHAANSPRMMWKISSVPALTWLRRRARPLRWESAVMVIPPCQNRLLSASSLRTMALAPMMQMKPTRFCRKPAAVDIPTSPVNL